VDKRTVKKARDTLNVLSTRSNALKLAYDDAIGRIEAQSSDDAALACKALSWIEYAQRPLTTAELCHALSIEPEERDLDSTAIYEIEDVLSVCAGLVTVDVESDIVRLVHYTTQEYLVCRLAEGWLPTARLDIAVACFTYLSMDEFRTGSCDSWREYNDRAEEFAFQKYAATYCAKHAEVVQREVWESASYFLLDENLVDAALQALAVESFYHVFPNHATGLHFTAASGSVDLTTMLLEHRDYPYGGNEKDDFDQTPLLLAAMWGHEGVVRLLIERCDVKADSADNLRYTPLLYAAEGGHEAVVRLLLQRGDVKINAKTHGDETPLLLAAESGHEAVVRLLLERNDINVNARDWDGNTPLFRAAERGREAVVRLLLERSDVDINARNQDGKTPLFRVAERGHEAVVRLLVACKDVDINARSHSGNTLLCSAVERGDEAVVRLLLERDDIDVNARDLYGKTPLFRAAERGHESVVRLLLERSDLDINAKNKRERTAVELAEYYGYEGIVRLLKDHNAQTE
jgi:ankyrin repeat protein